MPNTRDVSDRRGSNWAGGPGSFWFGLTTIGLGIMLGVGLGPMITSYLTQAGPTSNSPNLPPSDPVSPQNDSNSTVNRIGPSDQMQSADANSLEAGDAEVMQRIRVATEPLRAELTTLRKDFDALRAHGQQYGLDIDSIRQQFNTEIEKIEKSLQQYATLATATENTATLQKDLLARLESLETATKRFDSLADSFDQFVLQELPGMRRKIEGLRDPGTSVGYTDSQAQASDSQSPVVPVDPQERGKLIIDNDTGRVIPISINGRRQQLERGRNTFLVAFGNVEVEGDGRRWLLDSSLWRTHQGEQILYRNAWPP